jgi:hypothetical protein
MVLSGRTFHADNSYTHQLFNSNIYCLIQVAHSILGYDVTNVPSDGNCQFTSIALQLALDSTSSNTISQDIVDYLQSNKINLSLLLKALLSFSINFYACE